MQGHTIHIYTNENTCIFVGKLTLANNNKFWENLL